MRPPAEHVGAKPLLRGLARPISAAQRARLSAHLRALLAWHGTLARWPAPMTTAPDATAFASVYVRGTLRGCFGADEGTCGERVARAMLRALHDTRFGGVRGADHPGVVAMASYAHGILPLSTTAAETFVEAGRHGLLYVQADGGATILLPQVARDEQFGARGLLAALLQKARVETLEKGRLFAFETFDVSSHMIARARSPRAAGAAFLERLVDDCGHVDFAVNPRTGARTSVGEMHHGRAAVVLRALTACGRRSAAARTRRRLEADIEQALRGKPVPGWPTRADVVLGTLALAVLAGIDVAQELAALANRSAPETSAWHGAQVVAALGSRANDALYTRCVRDLDVQPWAPWTALAAQRLGDAAVAKRCAEVLARSVRAQAPYEGGVGFHEVPELALTALVVEALARATDGRSKRAAGRARAFLHTWQLDGGAPRGPVDPTHATGGFPLSPVIDLLRADVSAHALLALTPE